MNVMNRFRLDGKSVVVAGGARGIGLAVAETCASAGADIAIVDILSDEGRRSAEKLSGKSGRKVVFHSADLRSPEVCDEVARQICRETGHIDVLMNCVGINPFTEFLKIPAQEWRNVIDVNLNAMFFICQAVARRMSERRSGCIVSIGSNSGLIVDRPQPQAHYNASKAAVHHLVRSMAAELAPFGIRVNGVAPGFVATAMNSEVVENGEWLDVWKSNVPLGRLGTPDEIATAMLYLGSDASSYVTGEVIVVDGGYTCW